MYLKTFIDVQHTSKSSSPNIKNNYFGYPKKVLDQLYFGYPTISDIWKPKC